MRLTGERLHRQLAIAALCTGVALLIAACTPTSGPQATIPTSNNDSGESTPSTAGVDVNQQAPGASLAAPGTWTTGGKDGIGTSAETHTDQNQGVSKVWYTMSRGQLNEVYFPQVDVANVEDLMFLVTDGTSFVDNERDNTEHVVELADPTSLKYRQVNTAKNGKYSITKTYVTDPARSTLLIETSFRPTVPGLQLYVVYNPSLANSSGGDTGRWDPGTDSLVSNEGAVASALKSSSGFLGQSTGYVGHPDSDGYQNIIANKELANTYTNADVPGNIVQTAQIAVDEAGAATTFTVGLGFAEDEAAAAATVTASLDAGFPAAESNYDQGWHDYLNGLFSRVPIPRSVSDNAQLRNTYTTSLMVLKAHEDKDHPGANVASLTVPWGDVTDAADPDQAGYHHVWARDLYHVATAQLAAGDRDAAQRSVDYLFNTQQIKQEVTSDGQTLQPGAFPRFSRLDGVTDRGCCEQFDQNAYPIILQWQLNHATPDAERWAQIKLTAEHIAKTGPWTPAERWEEQDGLSPSTFAAEIAGLVAAGDLARINGDTDAAGRYEGTANNWRDQMDNWTFTEKGTFGDGSYYERIDGSYNADDTKTRCFKAGCFYERDIVDAGFLDLVRLGIRSADHPAVVGSLPELDTTTSEPGTMKTLSGRGDYWYRYNHDNYGEDQNGAGWTGAVDRPTTTGRLWPLLSGERGEYRLAAGGTESAAAAGDLLAMANSAGDSSYLIPEQIWDQDSTQTNGIDLVTGEHTGSATPLAWATAQFVRLALSIDVGKPVEMPAVTQRRYVNNVLLTVTVPATTDSTGMVPFIAGDLTGLNGGYAAWTPGLAAAGSNRPDGERMTRVDETTWTVLLGAVPGSTINYRFALNPPTRGTTDPDWAHVERGTNCAEVPNRVMTTPTTVRSQVTVAIDNWAGVAGC